MYFMEVVGGEQEGTVTSPGGAEPQHSTGPRCHIIEFSQFEDQLFLEDLFTHPHSDGEIGVMGARKPEPLWTQTLETLSPTFTWSTAYKAVGRPSGSL